MLNLNQMLNRISLLLVFLFAFTAFFSQIPPGYYNNAAGLSGEPLRTALYNIINGHSEQTYSSLWTHYQTTDNKGGGVVWDIYSDIPSGTPSYTYNFGTNQCGTYTAEGNCYNREHSFPKSWFNNGTPMYSDLFHVYPVDGFVNSMRGNVPYGVVPSPTQTSTNGSKKGANSYPGYSGTVFEPIDEYKGDLARTYFYMMTRYMNVASTWSSAMLFNGNLSTWAKNLLVAWDAADPVSQKEIDRNNAIYGIQGNRNPYIDNPQWVDYIWGVAASVGEIENPKLDMFFAKNYLNVSSIANSSTSLRVYNMLGEIVLQADVYLGENLIQLNLETGIYIAKAIINNHVYSLKFVR